MIWTCQVKKKWLWEQTWMCTESQQHSNNMHSLYAVHFFRYMSGNRSVQFFFHFFILKIWQNLIQKNSKISWLLCTKFFSKFSQFFFEKLRNFIRKRKKITMPVGCDKTLDVQNSDRSPNRRCEWSAFNLGHMDLTICKVSTSITK
jgi:anaerobic ribonucleoside-triphosphate reductase